MQNLLIIGAGRSSTALINYILERKLEDPSITFEKAAREIEDQYDFTPEWYNGEQRTIII